MSPVDEKLTAIVAAKMIATIDDVIAVMQELDAALPNDDGVKWFNLLYLKVTEAVRDNAATRRWENPRWLERLDVVFANIYFGTVAGWHTDRAKVARAWIPLFDCRKRRDIQRVQFALAGLNAHINHDLPIALVQVNAEQGIVPRRGTPEHRDFEYVNNVLDVVEGQVKPYLATGIVGAIDQDLGAIDDILAMWKVRKARETSWINGELLWHLRALPIPSASDDFLANLDRLVGLGSRGLLVPVGLT